MSYTPVPFSDFGGGLNLRDKEDVVSETEAIDALNVIFTTRGAVTQRDGYTNLTASGLTNRPASLEPFYTSSGTAQILAGCGTRLEAVDTAGAVVASATGLTSGGIWDFARFGAPGSEVAYAGNANDTIRKWSGAAWSAPANMPAAGSLAVMAVDQGNRLVAGRFAITTGGPTGGAATSNPSRVYFSNAGDPETWGTNNYIDFTPGDGEKVQNVTAWREFVFVFKETKFFVVYGTATDSAGNPIFNYRTIDAGVGVASPRAVTTATDGVYFMDRRGVYRTSGSEPTLVSSSIDPIFLGGASSFYLGGVLNHAQIALCAMGTHNQRVYLAFPNGTTNDRVLVFDPQFDWWTLYDIPASSLASFRVSNTAELVFGYAAGSNHIGRHSSAYTSDAGTAITSRWRSGWPDYGITQEKTIREAKLWGTGQVGMAVASDFTIDAGIYHAFDFAVPSESWGGVSWGAATWSSGKVITEHLRRQAIRGTTFSVCLFNQTLNATWSVHRLAMHLREQRIPQASVT